MVMAAMDRQWVLPRDLHQRLAADIGLPGVGRILQCLWKRRFLERQTVPIRTNGHLHLQAIYRMNSKGVELAKDLVENAACAECVSRHK